MKIYYRWVDTAKGIGIILVVLGHALSDTMLGNQGSVAARLLFDFIYSFHMPLFFFLAGFCGAKALDSDSVYGKKEYIVSRFKRLMVPYFFVGLLYVPIKIMMSSEVNSAVDIKMLPINFIIGMNPDFQLWTLYALFLTAVLICVCSYPIKTYKGPALMLSFVLCILSMAVGSRIHIIQEVMGECFFYLAGVLYSKSRKNERMRWDLVILTAGIFLSANVIKAWSGLSAIRMITGISGIIMICELAKRLQDGNYFWLNTIGRYSMDIYIMANLIQVSVRSVCLNRMQLPEEICCLLSTLLGIGLPIVTSKYFIRKIKITRVLILGDFARN